MQRTKPPFRADHVGSLLRSPALKEARAKREKNEITAEQLKAVEDREIDAIIKKQEEVGLQSITDGEYRRAFWNYDFLGKLDGVEAYLGERKIKFQGKQPKPMMLRVIGKLGSFSRPSDDRAFQVRAVAHQADAEDDDPVAVVAALPLRPLGGAGGDLSGHGRVLPRPRPAYRKAVRAFADAGCRYIQLDEVNFTYLCDPKLRQQVTERGDDPDKLPHIYAEMINAAISDVPADMTTAMHLCRGNFQSTFVASGGYEPVAEILFNEINIQAYFMEYDSDRAGGFEPLRFVPKGKTVVLGPRHLQVRHAGIARTRSSAGSTRRRNTSRSTSFACRRNAASPRPRRATSWPRTSNGRSCG